MKESTVQLEDNSYADINDDDYKELLELAYKIAEMNDELTKLASSVKLESGSKWECTHHEIVAHFAMLGNIAYIKHEQIQEAINEEIV